MPASFQLPRDFATDLSDSYGDDDPPTHPRLKAWPA
jgi:hypothetical protein